LGEVDVCVCVCVCVQVCRHAYMCAYTYIHNTYVRTHTHISFIQELSIDG